MANSRKLIVEIVGDSSKLDRSFKKVESRSGRFAKNVSNRTGGLLGGNLVGAVGKGGLIAGGGVVAGGLVLKGLNASIAAAKEAQVAQVNLQQAVRSSGLSYARFGKQIDATIQKQSRLAGIDDEEVSASFAQLVRSTGSVEKANKGVALAVNISRARHVSLAAATRAVERAYGGSETALKRFGVVVPKVTASTDALKAKIKEMQERLKGAKGAAREQILAQIDSLKTQRNMAKEMDKTRTVQTALTKAQRQFAGAAKAYGETATGAQERLNVAFENLEERVGQKLLPVLTKLSLSLVDLIDWSERNWPRFSKAVSDAYNTVRPVIAILVAQIKTISQVVEGMVKIVRGIANGEWSQVWAGIKQTVSNAVIGIVRILTALPRLILTKLSKAAFGGLEQVGTWIGEAIERGLNAVINRIVSAINAVIRGVNRVSGAVSKVVPGNLPKIPEIGRVGATAATPPRSGSDGGRKGAAGGGRGADVVVHSNLYLDGQKVASNTTRHQQQSRRVNRPQKRGPNSGR